jgi:hypothetical protein
MRKVTMFGPDFPFAYDDFLKHPAGMGSIPASMHGTEVAIIGAGIAGIVAAYELMKLGLRPQIYEADRIGGRMRSEPFKDGDGAFAELGAMRFPTSATSLFHYIDKVGLRTADFPNPLTSAAHSTIIELGGKEYYARRNTDLPVVFQEVELAWQAALDEGAHFAALQAAILARNPSAIKSIWNPLVAKLDEESFYGFIAKSTAFRRLGFRAREIFGQVGFGTGGWDTDYPHSILEILRVVATGAEDNQQLVVGGIEQLPRRLWDMLRTAACTGRLVPALQSCTAIRLVPQSGASPRARIIKLPLPTATEIPTNLPPASSLARSGCFRRRSTARNRFLTTSYGWRWSAAITRNHRKPS